MRTSALLQGLMVGGLYLCSAHDATGQGVNVIPRTDIGPLDANALKTSVDLVAKEVGLGGLGQIVPKCGETRAIKVVIDPANVVPELHDENNSAAATVPRPCPDLAIQSIERESSGIAGETYRVLVTIVNKGGATSPPDEVWATALTSAPGLNGWPETVPMHTVPGLAPGATYRFRVGGTVASVAHSWVRVFVDIKRLIEESDETNNLVDKTL